HRRGKVRRTEIESVVEPHHILDRVDGHAALADFSENAVRVAINPVKCRAVECGAESMCALMRGKKMKTLVRVLGQHQTGEQTGRLLSLQDLLVNLATGRVRPIRHRTDSSDRRTGRLAVF